MAKRLLPTGTFEDAIEPVGFLLQNRFHYILARRHTGPIGATSLGQFESIVEQVGDVSSAWAKRTHRQEDAQSNWPRSQYGHGAAGLHFRETHGVDAD